MEDKVNWYIDINKDSIDILLDIGNISEYELNVKKMIQDTEASLIRQKHKRKISQYENFEARVVELNPNISNDCVQNIVTRMIKP